MRICLDVDGCICQYDFPLMVKKFFGVDISPLVIYAYDLSDVLGVSSTLINLMFKEQVYGEPHFNKGAIETLTEWKARGYELVIFSNRIKYMGYMNLAEWLIKWEIPFSGIDIGDGKYDVHIDDMASKLMATSSKMKLLFNQPWNKRCLNITGELVRVKSWQEVREAIDD